MKKIIIPMLILALLSTQTKAFEEVINVPALSTIWVESPTAENDYRLISHISSRYGIHLDKAEEIVSTAKEKADDEFPTHTDILAIVAIESKFKQYAKNKNSRAKGLMQVLYKPTTFEIDKNLEDGTNLLKTYDGLLHHNKDAVIQAYNVGIGAYLSGIRNKAYLKRFKQAKTQLENNEA